jgi:hypothetical protein
MAIGWLIDAILSMLLKVFGWLFGQVTGISVDDLKARWRKRFSRQNILILGAKGTGKTSLLYLMRFDAPYRIVDGKRVAPNPTSGEENVFYIYDEDTFLEEENTPVRVQTDLSGDQSNRDVWRDNIQKFLPPGILYLIDGRLEEEKLAGAVSEVLAHVLSSYDRDNPQLRVLHLLLNFSDIWSDGDVDKQDTKEKFVRKIFKQALVEQYPTWRLSSRVTSIQLSPQENDWEDAKNALEAFADDLGRKTRK